MQAPDGFFYGTTYGGGKDFVGTVLKPTPAGRLTTLHSFWAQGGCPDGEQPVAWLVQASDGNIYGTTSYGGAYTSYGTVFQITPQGGLTMLHRFDGTDGGGGWCKFLTGSSTGQSSSGTDYSTIFSLLVVHPCAICGSLVGDGIAGARVGNQFQFQAERSTLA